MKHLVLIASKLYECHDSAKSLYGADFKSKVQWYVDVILKWNEQRKTDTLKTVLAICQTETVSGNGMAMMMFLAAAVEIIEPSK
jgi:hypothetical protein